MVNLIRVDLSRVRAREALRGPARVLLSVVLAALVAGFGVRPTSLADLPSSPELAFVSAGPQSVRGSYNPASRAVELANPDLRITLTYAPSDAVRLTVARSDGGLPLIERASTSLFLGDGSVLDLATAAVPAGEVAFQAVDEPGLGPGVRARAAVRIPRLDLVAWVEVDLFEAGPRFTYRLVLPNDGSPATGFAYLNGMVLADEGGGRVAYLSDDDAIKEGVILAQPMELPVGHGKPLLLRGSDRSRGLLMALVDPSDSPSSFRASALERGVAFQWLHTIIPSAGRGDQRELPRLFVQLVNASDLSGALGPYRELMQTLYPPAPLPSWFRQQWISWYLYGMDIDEQKLRSQIDYLATSLSDVGPWSILIDAGWYLAEGRPDSDWRATDEAKFPSGLRSLVDYAHDQGVKVVLYFSASYLDDRAEAGNWLGLKGIVDQHPEWLIPIQSGDPWRAFYYDYSNPGFQSYLREVLRDYFVDYGVDGIKVDGLMDTRLAVERGINRGFYSLATPPVFPTAAVYAFIYQEAVALRPDVFVEAGWRMPAFSAPHFSIARQSDDTPDFDSPYPSPGLREHVDYAIAQRLVLGQRPHLGNFWGDPNSNSIGLQWLDAGLALNAPVALGFDLPSMSLETLSEYRSRLAPLRPFAGEVHLPGGLRPDSFSSVSEGTTFLALFNRGDRPSELRAEAAAHGLPGGSRLAAYDVAAGRPLPVQGAVMARVEPRTLRLFVIRSEPGLLWTNSSYSVSRSPGGLSLEMNGPAALGGYAYVATPRPVEILLNGEPLSEGAWSYDAEAGVLRVDYPHEAEAPTRIEVRFSSPSSASSDPRADRRSR